MIRSTNSASLRKLRIIPFKLRIEKPFHNVDLFALHNGRLRPRTILASVFVNANEDDETKSGCLGSSIDVKDNNNNGVSIYSDSRSNIYADWSPVASVAHVLDKLKAIRLHLLASEKWNSSRIESCHGNYSMSAKNLVHHGALKCFDVEQVKEELSCVTLLNWEIDNSCVIASLEAIIRFLENSSFDESFEETENKFRAESMMTKVHFNTESLLGPLEDEQTIHIMVTLGREAIENENLVTDLIKRGTTIVRINCAHEDPSVWSEIINRVRTSSQMLEKPCRVLMDLAGPKLRTSSLKPGPNVIKISPKRNVSVSVISPAKIWLSHRGAGSPPTHVSPDTTLFVEDADFLRKLVVGDTLWLIDAREKVRSLEILSKFHVFSGIGLVAECNKTCYINSETELGFRGKKNKFRWEKVVDVPPKEPYLRLRIGDSLIISRDSSSKSSTTSSHWITCSSSLLFDSVKPREPISFDDGKITGIVTSTSLSEITVTITNAKPGGTKLGSEKSINIPDSKIRFQGLTSKDITDLGFVASQADIVGVSFVRDVNDIATLRNELETRKLDKLGVVLKIETKDGFEHLPEMLLEAMKCPNPVGVMIARGDLAVECGWGMMGDIQEEIMNICCAAHIPVVWATQVLESFVKSGIPTRAELTDVAQGTRASCIMLNKGKHIVEGVSFLNAIIRKKKKRATVKMRAKSTPH